MSRHVRGVDLRGFCGEVLDAVGGRATGRPVPSRYFADSETGACQAAHDGADRHVENRRGFAIAQSFDRDQQHHGALCVGRFLDRADDLLVQGIKLRIGGGGIRHRVGELVCGVSGSDCTQQRR